jgi:hypothetical protein
MYNTWTIFAVPVPEVLAPRLCDPRLENGANVDIRFADTGSSRYNLYVSKTPSTHPFHVASPAGKKECALSGLVSVGGGMKELQNYDLDAGLSVPPGTVLYILVTADNGPGTEGTPGTDSAGADRTTDSSCAH